MDWGFFIANCMVAKSLRLSHLGKAIKLTFSAVSWFSSAHLNAQAGDWGQGNGKWLTQLFCRMAACKAAV